MVFKSYPGNILRDLVEQVPCPVATPSSASLTIESPGTKRWPLESFNNNTIEKAFTHHIPGAQVTDSDIEHHQTGNPAGNC